MQRTKEQKICREAIEIQIFVIITPKFNETPYTEKNGIPWFCTEFFVLDSASPHFLR